MGSSRNLRLYPAYVVCLNGLFWFPVFFLYLTERVGLDGALLLEALYYVAVVVFEVPSGWASDRVGRRFALRAAAFLLGASYVAFFLGTSFTTLALAQVAMAAGFAFNSGTDTAFHYDSLVAAGREDEYGDREERIARLSFGAVGVAGLVGGVVGAIELRYAYLAAAAWIGVGFFVTLAFEPPEQAEAQPAARIDRQVLACIGDLRHPLLGWLFAASVLLTIVVHVPYQLYQPYIDALDLAFLPASTPTPILTGTHAFLAMLVASTISSRSVRIARRIGLGRTVLAGLLLGVVLIAAIGVALHPVVALLLVLRSGSWALMQAPMNAAITPRIPRERRASYLSVQSLSGRLAFGALLVMLSATVGDRVDYASIARTASIGALICGLGLVLLLVTWRRAGIDSPASTS